MKLMERCLGRGFDLHTKKKMHCMTKEERTKAYELFYLVKGHVKYFDDADLEAIVRDYTRRLWYNEEAHLYLTGFDQAYREFLRSHK